MELKLDEASTCLLALMIALLMYQSTRRSDAPLYHPILLGRQAEASKVRHANESPIWTNATSTSGRLVVRPANDIKTLRDIIHGLDGDFKVKVLGLAARLVSLAANLGASTEQKRIVGVACESSEAVALVLACALVPGLHPLLLPLHISSDLLPILQQESVAVVVSSKPDQIALPGIQVLPSNLENLTASQLPESASPDVHQSAISISVHHQGQWSLVDLNHLNITAAMFTLGRTLISQNKHQINASDRVLLGLPFGTPLGFALAITLVHLGAHFDFVIPVTFSSIVQKSPSVIFCSAAEAQSLYDALLQEGASTKSRLRALSSRVPVLREGRLPKPNFSGHILSQKSAPRAIVVFATSASDVLSQRTLDHLRAFLAIPVLQGFTHPLQPVPLALSHMHDFQLVHSNAAALVGPPSSNVEIKLTGMSDGQSIMCGNLQCRGPAVICNNKDNKSSEYEWWNADMQVHILPNGVLALQ